MTSPFSESVSLSMDFDDDDFAMNVDVEGRIEYDPGVLFGDPAHCYPPHWEVEVHSIKLPSGLTADKELSRRITEAAEEALESYLQNRIGGVDDGY